MKALNDDHRKCGPCKGTGELRSSHPLARRDQGYDEGRGLDPYGKPVIEGGMSGEIIAEATRSICGACRGAGIKT